METSLAVTLFDLQAEAGDQAGFGRGDHFGDTEWDDVQQAQIDVVVKTALRLVYFTQPYQDIPAAYDWSFLAPTAALKLEQAKSYIDLPDDFGGLRSTVIATSQGRMVAPRVPVSGDAQLYGARAEAPTQTGPPKIVYVEWLKGTSETEGQRARLEVFPIPDREYQLQVWYDILPNALSAKLPYVYGGAAHAETFLAAVRAAYEWKYLGNSAGPENAAFQQRLRASIEYDRKFKPVQIGPNVDRSDWPFQERPLPAIHFSYAGHGQTITPG